MGRKEIYKKPCVIEILNNSIVYGQQITPMGLCSSGTSPEGGSYGCGVGTSVIPHCGVGIGALSSACESGSAPYYGDVCSAGGSKVG
jgi:hypothetical protein